MPLGPDVSFNVRELMKDNKATGKARGANGRKRSRKQIIAIALAASARAQGKNPYSRRKKGDN